MNLTRKEFLGLAGGAAIALPLVSACGGGRDGDSSDSGARSMPDGSTGALLCSEARLPEPFNGHFNFALHFQKPGVAEKEFEKDVKASMRRFLYAFSGEAPAGVTEYLFMKKPANTEVLEGMPEPEKLPSWLTEADLDYYAKEYSRAGFRGALNMYRNMDRDWQELPQVGTGEVKQPTLFMGGKRDPSVIYAPFDPMIKAVPKLRKIIFLENCGHWVQQERADAVNQELIEFLKREIQVSKEG